MVFFLQPTEVSLSSHPGILPTDTCKFEEVPPSQSKTSLAYRNGGRTSRDFCPQLGPSVPSGLKPPHPAFTTIPITATEGLTPYAVNPESFSYIELCPHRNTSGESWHLKINYDLSSYIYGVEYGTTLESVTLKMKCFASWGGQPIPGGGSDSKSQQYYVMLADEVRSSASGGSVVKNMGVMRCFSKESTYYSSFSLYQGPGESCVTTGSTENVSVAMASSEVPFEHIYGNYFGNSNWARKKPFYTSWISDLTGMKLVFTYPADNQEGAYKVHLNFDRERDKNRVYLVAGMYKRNETFLELKLLHYEDCKLSAYCMSFNYINNKEVNVRLIGPIAMNRADICQDVTRPICLNDTILPTDLYMIQQCSVSPIGGRQLSKQRVLLSEYFQEARDKIRQFRYEPDFTMESEEILIKIEDILRKLHDQVNELI